MVFSFNLINGKGKNKKLIIIFDQMQWCSGQNCTLSWMFILELYRTSRPVWKSGKFSKSGLFSSRTRYIQERKKQAKNVDFVDQSSFLLPRTFQKFAKILFHFKPNFDKCELINSEDQNIFTRIDMELKLGILFFQGKLSARSRSEQRCFIQRIIFKAV